MKEHCTEIIKENAELSTLCSDALLVIGLPDGPTAHFKLTKLVLRKDIKVSSF